MELNISTVIKIILALIVIVAVVYGVYKAIDGGILDVFKNIGVGNSSKLFLGLVE